MPVVIEEKPAAIIVTADRPSELARYAAAELADHIEKATGVRLTLTTESALPPDLEGRVFIGDCRAARAAGIDVGKLTVESLTPAR